MLKYAAHSRWCLKSSKSSCAFSQFWFFKRRRLPLTDSSLALRERVSQSLLHALHCAERGQKLCMLFVSPHVKHCRDWSASAIAKKTGSQPAGARLVPTRWREAAKDQRLGGDEQ